MAKHPPSRTLTVSCVVLATASAFLSVHGFVNRQSRDGVIFAACVIGFLALAAVDGFRRRRPEATKGSSAMRARTIVLMIVVDIGALGSIIFAAAQIVRGERIGGAIIILVVGLIGLIIGWRNTARAFAYKPDESHSDS